MHGLGAFRRDHVPLIGGFFTVAERQDSHHASAVGAAADALRAVLPPRWLVRVRMPVALDYESEPEPDLAVVPGTWADYRTGHPDRPVLVVEIARASLAFDRGEKASLYARGGVRDYWIVNLVDRVLEVFRDPTPHPTAPHGWRYNARGRLGLGAIVSLLVLPSSSVAVRDLFV